MQPTETQLRTEARTECTRCPPWVLRCAHFAGQVIRLTDTEAVKQLHLESCLSRSWPTPYSVANDGVLARSDCGCPMENFWDRTGRVSFPSRADADAEFDRRDALLRGGPE